MTKTFTLLLCAVLVVLSLAPARAAGDCPVVGAQYRVLFADQYRDFYSLDSDTAWIIKVDAISRTDSNWIQIEFPPNANQEYNSGLAGKRWVNLRYVMELVPVH